MMQATRVNSRYYEEDRPLHRVVRMSHENKQIAEAIPYWPKTINQVAIAKKFNLTVKQIKSRVQVFQEEYLVFQEGTEISRLKRDLSNVEAE